MILHDYEIMIITNYMISYFGVNFDRKSTLFLSSQFTNMSSVVIYIYLWLEMGLSCNKMKCFVQIIDLSYVVNQIYISAPLR